jgi:O-antigen/teichoic acid export membrane protein
MNRVFENTSALFIAQFIGRLLSLGLMVILMQRYFTQEALGGYILAMSITNMIASIAELGMQSPLIREMTLHRRQARHFLGNALIIRFLLSIIAFGVMIGIGWLMFGSGNWLDYQPIIVRMILLLGLADIINSTAQLFRCVFRAFERMRYEALTVVVERSLVVFVGGVFIGLGINLVNFCVVVLIASIFNLGLSVSIVVRRFMSLRFHVDLGICKALMRQALPFALGNICNLIYFRIDALLIRILSPHGVTANTWYGLAYQLVYAFTILPGAFMGAMFPVIARTFADNKRMDFGGIYTDALRLMFLVGVPFAVGMATLSEKISSALFSHYEWVEIAPALRLLSWSGGLSFLTTVVITVLRATDKRRSFPILMATTALLNIALNFILIPRFSHVGAAMAMIISEAYLFIGSFVYISQRISKLTYIGFAIKAVIVSTLMGTGLMFLRDRFSIWILIPCAILFYLAGMAAVGELRRGKIPKRMEFKEESSF